MYGTVKIRRQRCLRMKDRVDLALLTAVVLLSVGCSDKSDTITVEGKISFNGTPVTSGVINFQPVNGQPMGGGVNSDGTYSYEVPPGEYKVRIDSPPAVPAEWKEGQPLPKLDARLVPGKYASYTTSGLTANITGEEDPQAIDFILP